MLKIFSVSHPNLFGNYFSIYLFCCFLFFSIQVQSTLEALRSGPSAVMFDIDFDTMVCACSNNQILHMMFQV